MLDIDIDIYILSKKFFTTREKMEKCIDRLLPKNTTKKKFVDMISKEMSSKFTIFTDGASKGNPGPSGAGIYILMNNQPILELAIPLGIKTNNEAEYLALLIACENINSWMNEEYDTLEIYSDSKLAVEQIKGNWKVNDKRLKIYNSKILHILRNKKFTIQHVYRENNKVADKLANIGVKKLK